MRAKSWRRSWIVMSNRTLRRKSGWARTLTWSARGWRECRASMAGRHSGLRAWRPPPKHRASAGPIARRTGWSVGCWLTRFRSVMRHPGALEYLKTHGSGLFDGVALVGRGMVDAVTLALRAIPALVFIVGSGRPDLVRQEVVAARPLRIVGAVVHVEPGLLDADVGDLVARAGGDTRLAWRSGFPSVSPERITPVSMQRCGRFST